MKAIFLLQISNSQRLLTLRVTFTNGVVNLKTHLDMSSVNNVSGRQSFILYLKVSGDLSVNQHGAHSTSKRQHDLSGLSD